MFTRGNAGSSIACVARNAPRPQGVGRGGSVRRLKGSAPAGLSSHPPRIRSSKSGFSMQPLIGVFFIADVSNYVEACINAYFLSELYLFLFKL